MFWPSFCDVPALASHNHPVSAGRSADSGNIAAALVYFRSSQGSFVSTSTHSSRMRHGSSLISLDAIECRSPDSWRSIRLPPWCRDGQSSRDLGLKRLEESRKNIEPFPAFATPKKQIRATASLISQCSSVIYVEFNLSSRSHYIDGFAFRPAPTRHSQPGCSARPCSER